MEIQRVNNSSAEKEELALPDTKTYSKDTAIKTVGVSVQGQTNRPVEQNSEHRSRHIGVLTLYMTKVALQNSLSGWKNSLLNKWGWDNWVAIWEEIKLDHLPYIMHEINSGQILKPRWQM